MYIENITFVIFVWNEEARIERVLKNLTPYGQVLIVDNESTDGTLTIARKYGAEILINKNPGWVEDEDTVAKVKATVKTDWIYWGFADEMIDGSTLDEIGIHIKSGKYDIINITRKNYFYGRFCHNAFADRMNRIFKKDAIDFSGNEIHGFGRVVVLSDRVKELPDSYYVHHFISNTAKSYLLTMDRYTDIEKPVVVSWRNFIKLPLAQIKLIWLNYIVRHGYKAGVPGFMLCLHMTYYSWLKAMKSWEYGNDISRDCIEARNDHYRDCILKRLSYERVN